MAYNKNSVRSGRSYNTAVGRGGIFDESNRTDADRQRLMRIFRHSVKQKTGLEITISVIKRQSFKAA
jgi:hypothetical protein